MADNRQFTDHNRVGGVNVYLQDKVLSERTPAGSAAAVANLKFLLVNGDDDGFNTAVKAYIDEAVRSALGALVDNLDKGTAVSRILGTDASHDLGSITPANLASVLGVPTKTSVMNWTFSGTSTVVDDLNNANYGIRRWGSSSKNKPDNSGTVFTFELYQTRKAQMAFSINGNVYYRYQNGDMEWQAWVTK